MNKGGEYVQKFRQCLNCLRRGHWSKNCKKRTSSVLNCGTQHNNFLQSDFSKKEATTVTSEATTAVAINFTQRRLHEVLLKVVNGNLNPSVQAMCDTVSSIFFVDKSIVSTLQLQGRKASLSGTGIHGSQNVKTEVLPISAHEKSRSLTIFVHEDLQVVAENVNLQGLKDR